MWVTEWILRVKEAAAESPEASGVCKRSVGRVYVDNNPKPASERKLPWVTSFRAEGGVESGCRGEGTEPDRWGCLYLSVLAPHTDVSGQASGPLSVGFHFTMGCRGGH